MKVWIAAFVDAERGHSGYRYAETKKEALSLIKSDLTRVQDLDPEDQELMDPGVHWVADYAGEFVAVEDHGLPSAVDPANKDVRQLAHFVGYRNCPGLGPDGLKWVCEFGSHRDNG